MPVPGDGIQIAKHLQMDPNDANCFKVEATNGHGLVSLTTCGRIHVNPLLPTFGLVWDGKLSEDIDWVNSSNTVACSWEPVVNEVAHYEVQLLRQGMLQLEKCDSQGLDLNTTIAIQRVDANMSTHVFKGLSLGSADYYCFVLACSVAGLCTASSSDGFKIDEALPYVGCLQLKGANQELGDLYQYPYASQQSVMPIEWVAPLHNSNSLKAWTLCPTMAHELLTNVSQVHNSHLLHQAPLESFEGFISYVNLTFGNDILNFTEGSQDADASILTSRSRSDWLCLSKMSNFSFNISKHSLKVEPFGKISLYRKHLYTLKITATKVSGAYASSNLLSFMYDDTPPEVGDISDVSIF